MRSVGVIGGSVNITASEEYLQFALFINGPVAIAFNVMDDFEAYESGIYTNPYCFDEPMDLNHAMLVVGWGTENGKDFWILKNSWGTEWGEEGFARVEKGVNLCGIKHCNSFPYDVVDLAESSSDSSWVDSLF